MARFFVSSRMAELFWERKKVVELLHLNGHTPLFFEREPWIDSPDDAKKAMDDMLRRCDALVQLHYLTAGMPQEVLGDRTPIWYEFEQFRSHGNGPCILLYREPYGGAIVDPTLAAITRKVSAYPRVEKIAVKENQDWTGDFVEALARTGLEQDSLLDRERFVVRYSGRDYIGLLEAVSRILFRMFQMNIDYLSYAAVAKVGALCMTCSTPGELAGRGLMSKMGEALDVELRKLSESQNGPSGSVECMCDSGAGMFSVAPLGTACETSECFLEVRHADLPGQVHAICSIIKDLQINIDEAHLHPAEPGFPGLRTLRLWLSKKCDRPEPARHPGADPRCVMALAVDERLRSLIGVRSVGVQILSRGV